MADLLSLPTPPPDFPPPIEACEYECRLAELLMLLMSLEQVLEAGREEGVKFVRKIMQVAYEVNLEDLDPTSPPDELVAKKSWREQRASKRASEVVMQHARLVYSLSLVMTCSIFEQFLNHLLDALLAKEPRIAGGRTMRLGEVYDAKSSAEVLSRFREVEIREFDRLSVREKVDYFVKKCNVRREVLFSFNHCQEHHRQHARQLGERYLYSIFGIRNTIAHTGEQPVTEIKTIADAVGFFQALIAQMSKCLGGKYGVHVIATSEELVAWDHRDEIRRLRSVAETGPS